MSNRDTNPNSRWDEIYKPLVKLFDKERAKKGEKKRITELICSIEKHIKDLEKVDSKVIATELLSLLKPGQTTTLLIDDKEKINELKEQYKGINKGPYIKLIINEKKLRLLWKRDYDWAVKRLKELKSHSSYALILEYIIFKIELAAFCKGGSRRARWKLPMLNSEYANEENCYGVAAKLTWLFLEILEVDLKEKKVIYDSEKLQKCKENCKKELSKDELKFISSILPKNCCPLCLNRIELIDFVRNGRNDPNSIVFGHYEERGSRINDVHLAKNAFWMHRTCNHIQGIYTIEDRIPFLKEIVENHQKNKISWKDRG